jgi:glycosyltransferase involved in cell wall biosynthesis
VLFIGRIAREKGIDILIRAFILVRPLCPDWALSIIGPSERKEGGDGLEYLRELRSLAQPICDAVTFGAPIYDGTLLVEELHSARIFVYPSVAEQGESFGMAPLEAMACGCAVLTSRLRCFSDFVVPEINALTFDHHDKSGRDLAAVILRLVSDRKLQEKLSANALETAALFSTSRVAERFLSDFEELLGRSRSGL